MSKIIKIVVIEGPADVIDAASKYPLQLPMLSGSERTQLTITELTFEQFISLHSQANIPRIYDIYTDSFRPVEQKDIDQLLVISNDRYALAKSIDALHEMLEQQRKSYLVVKND